MAMVSFALMIIDDQQSSSCERLKVSLKKRLLFEKTSVQIQLSCQIKTKFIVNKIKMKFIFLPLFALLLDCDCLSGSELNQNEKIKSQIVKTQKNGPI